MKNRIALHLTTSKRMQERPQSVWTELRGLAKRQVAFRLRQVETYVQTHPAAGVGAAFCVGIFLGWYIKRN